MDGFTLPQINKEPDEEPLKEDSSLQRTPFQVWGSVRLLTFGALRPKALRSLGLWIVAQTGSTGELMPQPGFLGSKRPEGPSTKCWRFLRSVQTP